MSTITTTWRVPTDDGGTVLVEVSSAAGIVTRGTDHSGVFARAQQTFERALSQIRPAVQGVIDELLSIGHSPDDVSVELGIELHAAAGAFIATANTTSNFNVKQKWKRPAEIPERDS
ncbi:CU044_2847 family protein [Pseudarthrobacter sp. N5]|uniref:CU044_2847 family protein n=1 Tax=Pseudarthrobacter sp. N5 TaxID=3418416 RepID=UPI003CF5368E